MRTLSLLAALVLGHSPIPTAAQDADPENQPRNRWKASAELSYTDQSGNQTLRLFTSGLNLSHLNQDRFELDFSLQSRYGEDGEKTIARSHYASLGFDLRPQDVWSPFLFVDAERDPFKRLELRLAGGAGGKYTFYRRPQTDNKASVSLALLVSYENRTPLPEAPRPDLDSGQRARWSLRLKGNQALGSDVTLTHLSSYQPVWDRSADYLLRTETGIKAALSERFALSVVYQLDRTSLPPEGVSPMDRILKTGIILDF